MPAVALGAWLAIGSSLGSAACSGRSPSEEDAMQSRPIEDVLEERTPEWMSRRWVVGTGIGLCDGSPCLVVFVDGDVERLRRELPERVEGYRVDLRRSGRFEARDTIP